ncbi:MAG: molybdopterin-dependent oxidoreductase, partial [Sinobacteraceae bacterium]|nr:molybdopterin-dependent oxidoreductase [Nevskiaceae bacterium]
MNSISKIRPDNENPAAETELSALGASRRAFLKNSGGLVLAFSLAGPALAFADESLQQTVAAGGTSADTAPFPSADAAKLDAWLAIHPDNTATLFTGKVEQGNGSPNALGQIAADELDFPFDKLFIVMGTTTTTIDQGPTYGSMAVRYAGPQIRHAAAAGRQVLLKMASKHFGVAVDKLAVEAGVISVAGSSRHISYGKLVDGQRLDVKIGASGKTFGMKVAPEAKLKDPSKYTVVGTSVPRKDIPGKVTGQFTYLQDVRVPGMLHGRVVRPYGVGAKLLKVDESGLKAIPGFVQVVRVRNFLGVVAETEWAAIKAAQKLGSKLHRSGPNDGQAKWSDWQGLPKMEDLWETLRHTSGKDITVADQGDVDAALQKDGVRALKATYRTPFETHGSIGPECAIADVGKDYAKFWAGTQMPHQARRDMAKMLELPLDRVKVTWVEASGQYGRNGLEPVMADAALMSRAVGKPVRVQWMRWDSHGWDPKEPPIVQDLAAAVD